MEAEEGADLIEVGSPVVRAAELVAMEAVEWGGQEIHLLHHQVKGIPVEKRLQVLMVVPVEAAELVLLDQMVWGVQQVLIPEDREVSVLIQVSQVLQ
jgi:hypothetical protein